MLSRRHLIFGASVAILAGPVHASSSQNIHVFKGRNCGCCGVWANILKSGGFSVTEEELFPSDLVVLKARKGVPNALASCHTAEIDGYVIEGHVPPADIRRLLSERPEAIGLAVPGMPYGSPGMGPESEREAYDVILILRDGGTKIFSSYPKRTAS